MNRVQQSIEVLRALRVKPARVARVSALVIGALIEAYTHGRGIPQTTVDKIITAAGDMLGVVASGQTDVANE